jgi:RNA polymerase sigma-70 factor (ECF subfamily)
VTHVHKSDRFAPLTGVTANPALAVEGRTSSAAHVRLSATLPGVTFEQVFGDYGAFVWRTLRRLGVSDVDVEDVCQEVFLVVHRRLSVFEARSSLRTWIYGICVRVASEHRRRHRRREELCAAPPEQSVPASQDHDIEQRRALAVLDAALDRLDDDKRAVFVLYELEELSMTEVAEVIGCPAQTAYSRLHAARRIMKDAIEGALRERSEPPCP